MDLKKKKKVHDNHLTMFVLYVCIYIYIYYIYLGVKIADHIYIGYISDS